MAGSEQEVYATSSLRTAVSTGICRITVINITLHVKGDAGMVTRTPLVQATARGWC